MAKQLSHTMFVVLIVTFLFTSSAWGAESSQKESDLSLKTDTDITTLYNNVLEKDSIKKLIAEVSPSWIPWSSGQPKTKKTLEDLILLFCELHQGIVIPRDRQPSLFSAGLATFFTSNKYISLTEETLKNINDDESKISNQLVKPFIAKVNTWFPSDLPSFTGTTNQNFVHQKYLVDVTQALNINHLKEKVNNAKVAWKKTQTSTPPEKKKSTPEKPSQDATLTQLQIMKLKMINLMHKISAK
ncbi:MAG: hypothetical protein H6679_04650 [Epsilonproteobacteria bacterium]|nr:hypothetical protein [Campylobacterota bacterium]